jgi:hypothetical protein
VFLGLGRSWWPCRPGQRVDEESRHRQCGCRGGTRWHWVTCGRLRAAADGSGRRPKFGRCSRRSPRRSPTDGGWRGSAGCCSMAEVNGEASRGERSEEDGFESPTDSAVDKQHGTMIACATCGGRKACGGWSAAAGAVGRQRSGGSCLSGAWSKVSVVSDCSTGLGPIRCTILFPIVQKLLNFCNSNMLPSRKPKMSKLGMVLELNILNNFSHWVDFQFRTEFKL